MDEQDPLLVPVPEAVTSAEVFAQLNSLEPEEQLAFYNSWLDRTVPGRITDKFNLAEEASRSGDKQLEQIRVLELALEMDATSLYAERDAKGELTPEELATKEALSIIFPDKWPFKLRS